MNQARILIVDDRPDIRLSLSFLLEDNNYWVYEAQSPYQAQKIIEDNQIDLIFLDMNYTLDTTSGEEGLELLRWLAKHEPDLPAIAMTAWSNVELAVKAMQIGASDFIEKPWENQRLLQVIEQQLKITGLKRQNQRLSQRLENAETSPPEYQWRSACMTQLMAQISSVAATDVTILLTGDNGTGKSQLANYIHHQSKRSANPLISVNMGAIAESLFESEMFGHTKGAFTDAKSNRIGRFELAQYGTLFLDEISNVPLSQQAKLLRVVESGEFEVLGSSKTKRSYVRLISASNADFSQLISDGMFREDLFYRLNTLEFRVPSLKERTQDIIPLADYFIGVFSAKYQRHIATLTPCAQQALSQYHWPGNIRELSHLMERAVLLTPTNLIDSSLLAITPITKVATIAATEIEQLTLEQAEILLIKNALLTTNNSISDAANLLGLTKSSLYRRIEKYQQQLTTNE